MQHRVFYYARSKVLRWTSVNFLLICEHHMVSQNSMWSDSNYYSPFSTSPTFAIIEGYSIKYIRPLSHVYAVPGDWSSGDWIIYVYFFFLWCHQRRKHLNKRSGSLPHKRTVSSFKSKIYFICRFCLNFNIIYLSVNVI